MGGLILIASIIIWALSYFPRYSISDIPESYAENADIDLTLNPNFIYTEEDINELILSDYQENHSILSYIGRFIQPVMKPLDLGWKACCSLLTGCAAKEVVVSTLGVLYVDDNNAELLSDKLQTPSKITGKAPFTTASALGFLVFVLLYFPCIATIAAIIKETGSWKWGIFSIFYNTSLAWVFAFIIYRIALLF